MSTLELKTVKLFYPEIGFEGIFERKKKAQTSFHNLHLKWATNQKIFR